MENDLKKTVDEELVMVIGFVDEYLDATSDARGLSTKCRDYYDSKQYTEAERETLRARKQPCITNNRIKPKVEFLRGMEMRTRTDPKAYPRNPEDEKSAETSTDMLRYISDNNRSEQKTSKGFKSYLIEGTQGHEVVVEMKNGRFEVVHNVLDWDRLWWDPHSREEDFSDARYKGTLQWMDQAQGKEKFPKAKDNVWVIDSSNTGVTTEDTHEDKPSFFTDAKRKRVRVFFCYFKKLGVWHYTIFTKGGFIERPKPSPYLDDNGIPEPQFEFQSAFVDIDGNRYGEVASYLDLQDEVNKRRSKLLHLISVRQTWAKKGAVKDVAVFKKEAAKADGHLEFTDGEMGKDFGFVPTHDMAAGQGLLLTEAKQEIDSTGANAALAGTEERKLSGRALQSLQQGSSVVIGPLFDGNKYCKNRVHRMMFNRAKQFWKGPRWIRITDNENNLRWTGLNQEITLRDQLVEEFGDVPEQFENDPRLTQVVGTQNPVNELDVDIIIDESEDTVTLQQEQFEILAKLYEVNPSAVGFELVVKASQLRNKEELLKMLKGGTEEEQEALAAAQQKEQAEQQALIKEAAAVKMGVDKSTIEKNQATTKKTLAEADKIEVDTAIDVHEVTDPGKEEETVS
jgi:hypothetical protein